MERKRKRLLPVNLNTLAAMSDVEPLRTAEERLMSDPDYAKRAADSFRLSHSSSPPNGGVLGPLKHIRDRLAAGLFPSAEAFYYVSVCFDKYLSGDVETLDEAFNVGGIQKSGNAVADDKYIRNEVVVNAHMLHLITEQGLTQEKAAEQVKEKLGLEDEISTMTRGLRKFKSAIEKAYNVKLKRKRRIKA